MVYIRRGGRLPPLTPYDRPYQVLERGTKYFQLQLGDREVNITVDRLKPHRVDAPATPVAPACRGRHRRHHHRQQQLNDFLHHQ